MQAVMTSDKRWILTSMRIKWLIKYKDDCLNIKKKKKQLLLKNKNNVMSEIWICESFDTKEELITTKTMSWVGKTSSMLECNIAVGMGPLILHQAFCEGLELHARLQFKCMTAVLFIAWVNVKKGTYKL